MVVTVSGELYATKAYTKSSTSTPSSIYGGDCANVDGWEGYFSDCDSTYPLDGITNGGGKRKTGNSATGKAAGGRRRGRANNAQKQPAAASVGVASANYDERYYEEDHNVYYNATALIIVGSVTSINGQKYNKEGGYTDGTVQVRGHTCTGYSLFVGAVLVVELAGPLSGPLQLPDCINQVDLPPEPFTSHALSI